VRKAHLTRGCPKKSLISSRKKKGRETVRRGGFGDVLVSGPHAGGKIQGKSPRKELVLLVHGSQKVDWRKKISDL